MISICIYISRVLIAINYLLCLALPKVGFCPTFQSGSRFLKAGGTLPSSAWGSILPHLSLWKGLPYTGGHSATQLCFHTNPIVRKFHRVLLWKPLVHLCQCVWLACTAETFGMFTKAERKVSGTRMRRNLHQSSKQCVDTFLLSAITSLLSVGFCLLKNFHVHLVCRGQLTNILQRTSEDFKQECRNPDASVTATTVSVIIQGPLSPSLRSFDVFNQNQCPWFENTSVFSV